MKLESLTSPDDDPALVREKCFEVGWLLRSPDSWEYINLFPQTINESRDGVVTIPELIKAVKRKHETIQNLKNPQANNDRISADKSVKHSRSAHGKASKSVSRR